MEDDNSSDPSVDESHSLEFDLEPGTHEVEIRSDEHGTKIVEVEVGEGGAEQVFRLPQESGDGSFEGVVKNLIGESIEGATIAVDGQTVSADENGEFDLELQPGQHTITVNHTEYETKTTEIEVEAGETIRQWVELDYEYETNTGTIELTASDIGFFETADVILEGESKIEETLSGRSETYSVPAGPWVVSVSRESYKESTAVGFVDANQTTAIDIDSFDTLPEGTVEGTIMDLGGSPVEGVEIEVDTGTSRVGAVTTTTDADGYYELDVMEGDHSVTISHGDYVDNETNLTIVGHETQSLDASLTEYGQLEGTVRDLHRTDNSVDDGEVSVNGPTSTSTSVGDDHTYSFTNLPPGEYEVEAAALGLDTKRETVTIVPGETAEIDFSLDRDYSYWSEELWVNVHDGDGSWDDIAVPSEITIAGNTVESVYAPDGRVPHEEAGLDPFIVDGGWWTVTVDPEGYERQSKDVFLERPGDDKSIWFDVQEDGTGVPENGTVTGTVRDGTGDRVTPVEGATVLIDGEGSTTTDSNGEYELTADGGVHTLEISKSSYHTEYRELIVAVGETVEQDVTLTNPAGKGTISGRVRKGDWTDEIFVLSDIHVEIRGRDSDYSEEFVMENGGTDEYQTGHFDRIVPEGPYEVSIDVDGYDTADSVKLVSVHEGDSHIRFDLYPARTTVTGEVRDRRGDPVPNAEVTMSYEWTTQHDGTKIRSSDIPDSESTTTDSSGTYEIDVYSGEIGYEVSKEMSDGTGNWGTGRISVSDEDGSITEHLVSNDVWFATNEDIGGEWHKTYHNPEDVMDHNLGQSVYVRRRSVSDNRTSHIIDVMTIAQGFQINRSKGWDEPISNLKSFGIRIKAPDSSVSLTGSQTGGAGVQGGRFLSEKEIDEKTGLLDNQLTDVDAVIEEAADHGLNEEISQLISQGVLAALPLASRHPYLNIAFAASSLGLAVLDTFTGEDENDDELVAYDWPLPSGRSGHQFGTGVGYARAIEVTTDGSPVEVTIEPFIQPEIWEAMRSMETDERSFELTIVVD